MNQTTLDKIIKNGVLVAVIGGREDSFGRVFMVEESRGYHTQFKRQEFFYFVGYQNQKAVFCKGVTGKGKTLSAFWERQGFTKTICNESKFNQFTS